MLSKHYYTHRIRAFIKPPHPSPGGREDEALVGVTEITALEGTSNEDTESQRKEFCQETQALAFVSLYSHRQRSKGRPGSVSFLKGVLPATFYPTVLSIL